MKLKHIISLAFYAIVCSLSAQNTGTIVHNEAELKVAIKSITAGAIILLANGVWNDIEIVVKGNGHKPTREVISYKKESEYLLAKMNNLTFKNSKKLNLILAAGEPVISINNSTFENSAGLTSYGNAFVKENVTTKKSNI